LIFLSLCVELDSVRCLVSTLQLSCSLIEEDYAFI
jgi:hypothetical protein